MILALLATLGATVVAFVLYPVFTGAGGDDASAVFEETDIALSDLNDKKAMLYDAIQDLDFEKEAGKVSDSDYEYARDDYLAQVAAVMAKLDALTPPEPESESESTSTSGTSEPQPGRTSTAAKDGQERACANCGELNPKASNFCFQCGNPMAKACASCGESLLDKARFCNACGEKVSA